MLFSCAKADFACGCDPASTSGPIRRPVAPFEKCVPNVASGVYGPGGGTPDIHRRPRMGANGRTAASSSNGTTDFTASRAVGRLSRGSPRPVGQRRRGPRTGPGPPRAVRVPPRTRSRLREVRGLRRVQEEGHPGPRDRGDDHGRARRPGPGTGGSSRLPYHAARTVSARPAKRTECKSCPARAGWRRPTIGRAATRQWDRAVQQAARSSGLKDENGYGDCPDMTTHRATAVRTCHCCARVIRVNCGGGASNPS